MTMCRPSLTAPGRGLAEGCVALPRSTTNNVEMAEQRGYTHGSEALLALAAARIDAALPDRALLYGSTPPEARDLDLIVSERGAESAAAVLAGTGYGRRGTVWARFEGRAV